LPWANEICCNLKENILELNIFAQQRDWSMMKIILNGQKKELEHNQNLKNIIDKFCKNASHIIAEVNGEIVRSPQWPQTIVSDGDSIELLNFVGGG
jgi:thiamine biosynthesis protein ThiS